MIRIAVSVVVIYDGGNPRLYIFTTRSVIYFVKSLISFSFSTCQLSLLLDIYHPAF